MQFVEADHARLLRLRVVFGDTVLTYSLAADASVGEIARRLEEPSSRRHGSPVAIDVTLYSCPTDPFRQPSCRKSPH
jgi:hypothetical protein